MARTIDPTAKVSPQLHRLWNAQLESAQRCYDERLDDPARAVHQLRRTGKRLRALVALLQNDHPTVARRLDRRLRKSMQVLGRDRDRVVLQATTERLGRVAGWEEPAIGYWLRKALPEPASGEASAATDERMAECLAGYQTVGAGLRKRYWASTGPKLLAAAAVTFAQARQLALECAEDAPARRWHRWRRPVKYHRFQLGWLNVLWPELISTTAQAAEQLEEQLGLLHDVDLWQTYLIEGNLPLAATEASQQLMLAAEMQRSEHRQRCLAIGLRLYAETPKAWRSRMQAYWWGACQ